MATGLTASAGAQIEEVTSVLTPAPGVSVFQALADAQLSGYELILIQDNTATIVWYKRGFSDEGG